MDFIIRLLDTKDLEQINTLFIETVRAINVKDYNTEQIEQWAPLNKSVSGWQERLKNHIAYVAETNNSIVGFGDITRDGEIDHLYVHKDYQGKGIATLLLDQLENEAHKLGLKEIHTVASITAKPFFEKRGFINQETTVKKLNGVDFTVHKMNKMLRR